MSNINNTWYRLISDCIIELCKYDVKIIFSNHNHIITPNEGARVNGYWNDADEKHLTLACAIGKPIEIWGPIFAHEFCHFLQWKDKEKIWHDYASMSEKELFDIFHNKPISKERLEFCLNVSRDIELDCEKRTVKLFKKYKIPVDISDYIKGANVYIHFYNHIKQYRHWYPPKKMPYANQHIKEKASSVFYKDYTVIPPELEKLFNTHYPVKRKSNILD